ncbi:MAG: NusG domain II-containing protein [Bacteroidetes bacterium]|nr:NusG domain II-containing protein [Bacteroidota bacterium]
MNRRDFLKLSSIFVAAGVAAPAVLKSMTKKTLEVGTGSFSLEVITDNPEMAAALIEQFAKKGYSGYSGLKYSEYPVSGDVTGDLILVRNGQLVNYTVSGDEESMMLKEIRSKLSLPSMLSNPVRIRLYRDNGGSVSKLFVARQGKIIKTINPYSEDSVTLYGKTGGLVLGVSGGAAAVSKATCRHEICKRMGSINKTGDYITCIPNELHIFAE